MSSCGSLTAGNRLSDGLLNLMALRYGSTPGSPDPGVMTLENFISMILRLECMNRESIKHTWLEQDQYGFRTVLRAGTHRVFFGPGLSGWSGLRA